MKAARLFLIATIGTALSGCGSAPEPTESTTVSGDVARLPDAGLSSVYRVADPDNGVVCYVSNGYKAGGISCLHMGEEP